MSKCEVYDTVYNCTRPRQGCTDQGEKKSFFPLALTGHSNSVFFLNGEIVRCKIVIIFDKKKNSWIEFGHLHCRAVVHWNSRCWTSGCVPCCGSRFCMHIVRCLRYHHSILTAKLVNIDKFALLVYSIRQWMRNATTCSHHSVRCGWPSWWSCCQHRCKVTNDWAGAIRQILSCNRLYSFILAHSLTGRSGVWIFHQSRRLFADKWSRGTPYCKQIIITHSQQVHNK